MVLGWAAGLSEISTHILQAELRRRDEHDRPACGSKGGKKHYNTAAHVFALFLILFLSTAGAYRWPASAWRKTMPD